MKRKRMLYSFFGIFGLMIAFYFILINAPFKEVELDKERQPLVTANGAKMAKAGDKTVDKTETVTLTNIKGDVFVVRKHDDETTEERVTSMTKLAEGDRLLTKSDSFVELIVNKGERALIGENSEVEIKILKKINDGLHIVLKQTAGHIFHTGQHVNYQVELGDYVTNAIGTNFFTMIDSTGNPSLSVLSGLVSVSEPGSPGSENVTTPILPGLQITGSENNEKSITSTDIDYLVEHLDVEIIKQIIRLKPVLDEENQELFANNESEFRKLYESILPRIITKVLETGKMARNELSGLIDEVNQTIDDENRHLNMDDLTEEVDSDIEITASSLEELFVMLVDNGIIDHAFLHRYRENLSIPSSITSSINITPQTSSVQQENVASRSTVRRNYAASWGNNTGEESEKRERISEKYKDLINQLEGLGDQILYIENGEQSFSLPEFVATSDAVTGKSVGTTKHGIVDVWLDDNRVIMKPLSKGNTSILVSVELEGVIFSTNVNVTVQDKKDAEQAENLQQLNIDLKNIEDQYLRLSAGPQFFYISSRMATIPRLKANVTVADQNIVNAEIKNDRVIMTPKKLGHTTITVKLSVDDKTFTKKVSVDVYEKPLAPRSISFTDTDPNGAYISGMVTIEKAVSEENINTYALYWARNEKEVVGDPIVTFTANESNHQYRIRNGTRMPFNANGFIAVSQNDASKTQSITYVKIDDLQKPKVKYVNDETVANGRLGQTFNISLDQLVIVDDAWGKKIKDNDPNYEWKVLSTNASVATGVVEFNSLKVIIGNKTGEAELTLILKSKQTNETIVSIPVKIVALPLDGPSGISFSDTNVIKGFLGGTFTIEKATYEHGIESYRLYWANRYGMRLDSEPEPFAIIPKTKNNLNYTLPSVIKIPVGAEKVQVVSSNGVVESKDSVSIDIVDNQKITLHRILDPFIIQSNNEAFMPLDGMLMYLEKQSPIELVTLHSINYSGEAISNVTTNSDESALVFDTEEPGTATITIIGDGRLFGETYRNLAFKITVVVKDTFDDE